MSSVRQFLGRRLERRENGYAALVGDFTAIVVEAPRLDENGVGVQWMVRLLHDRCPIMFGARSTIEEAIAHAETSMHEYARLIALALDGENAP